MSNLETAINNIGAATEAMNDLTDAVNVNKSTLDSSVADAEGARDQSQAARDTANQHKLAAESAATSATNTASSLTGFDLESIAETKAETAVDVFVYDTSQDSDGGAWRHRTQHTSWYNEPLSTAIRGARREFPAVAVIVAETDTVTIYDGDDPALPIWKVLNSQANEPPGGYAAAFWMGPSSARQATSICALDGTLSLTVRSDTESNGIGLFTANLISDKLVRHSESTANSGIWQGTFADLSDPEGIPITIGTAEPIADNSANDVAMTVLPDAPIDQATGLPVPTIAVATDGGTSIIRDDGTVVSGGEVNESWKVIWVGFASDNVLWGSASSIYGATLQILSSPPYEAVEDIGEGVNGYQQIGQLSQGFGQNTSWPFTLGRTYGFIPLPDRRFASSATKGLTTISDVASNRSGSMVAYTTSTYNTGWMNGDIKGAFLSDTDYTNLVGSGELVTNGTFDTNLTGWTDDNSFWSVVSGRAYHAASTAFNTLRTVPTVTTGAKYILSFDYEVVSGQIRVQSRGAGNVPEGTTSDLTQKTYGVGSGSVSIQFVPGSSFESIAFARNDALLSTEFYIDNVSVKLADADRSVNNNGLIINGTVTRSPVATGADLVAYSGFSGTNYLEQPYNPDLDFGTGDFCLMGWVRYSDTSDFTLLFRAQDRSVNAPPSGLNFWVYNGVVKANLDGANVTDDNIESLSFGEWHFVALVRKGDAVFTFVDGKIVNTDVGNSALSVGGAGHALSVGDGYYDNSVTVNALALWRISATAPTPEQIKRIYEDEKVLFQENAQATLYGSTDVVTALAHDPVTDLLHVGTSDGRSVFQGLRRVDNTTAAVSTAISASNNLVVEE